MLHAAYAKLKLFLGLYPEKVLGLRLTDPIITVDTKKPCMTLLYYEAEIPKVYESTYGLAGLLSIRSITIPKS